MTTPEQWPATRITATQATAAASIAGNAFNELGELIARHQKEYRDQGNTAARNFCLRQQENDRACFKEVTAAANALNGILPHVDRLRDTAARALLGYELPTPAAAAPPEDDDTDEDFDDDEDIFGDDDEEKDKGTPRWRAPKGAFIYLWNPDPYNPRVDKARDDHGPAVDYLWQEGNYYPTEAKAAQHPTRPRPRTLHEAMTIRVAEIEAEASALYLPATSKSRGMTTALEGIKALLDEYRTGGE